MTKEHSRLLAKIAFMYYSDDLSQQEIAKVFNFSRSKVSRLLVEAREQGIVQINITTPVNRCTDLEQQLQELYSLNEVIVVPVYSMKDSKILDSLGKAGADYLMNHLEPGMTVGFSMGETLKKVSTYLTDEKKIPCDVVPIMGGNWPGTNSEFDANTISQKVAEKLGATHYPLYTPAIVSNQQLKESIFKDPSIRNVLKKTLELNITMVSVGVESSYFAHAKYLTEVEKQQVTQKNVVGEVACWFFDANGAIADLNIHNRVVGQNFMNIKDKSKIVLVSGTNGKKKAIAAALNGKWVDTLITDEKVAEFLIRNRRC